MIKPLDDANKCLDLIQGYDFQDDYIEPTYKYTNERLNEILNQYDIKDKDVLSVLASSDQIFSLYYLGAKNVDSFDFNPLTNYYFYLKKWLLLKYKTDRVDYLNTDLLKTLDYADSSIEEKNAKVFWKYLLENAKVNIMFSNMFKPMGTYSTVPYSNDINGLIKVIKSKKSNFTRCNIATDQVINKQYDVIVLSNIMEYIFDYEDDELVKQLKLNLKNLLKPNGIVICTNFAYYDENDIKIFNSDFEYIEGSKEFNKYAGEDKPICFALKKR